MPIPYPYSTGGIKTPSHFGYLKETSSEGRTIGLGSREKDKGLPEALIRANHMSPINVGVTGHPVVFLI